MEMTHDGFCRIILQNTFLRVCSFLMVKNEICLSFDPYDGFSVPPTSISGDNGKQTSFAELFCKTRILEVILSFTRSKMKNASNLTSSMSFQGSQHSFVVEMRSQ